MQALRAATLPAGRHMALITVNFRRKCLE